MLLEPEASASASAALPVLRLTQQLVPLPPVIDSPFSSPSVLPLV